MEYIIQRGDTISKVKRIIGVNWETLKKSNPHAIGRTKDSGNWFLKEGAKVKVEEKFETVLYREKYSNKQVTEKRNLKESSEWVEYSVKPGDSLWSLAVDKFQVNIADIIKDNNISNPSLIKPGQILRIRRPDHIQEQKVTASWYGQSYHGKMMANGDVFNMYANTIAHKNLPFGTKVELENPETGVTEIAVVTDRGPYVEGRDVDISFGLAKKLSLIKKGVGQLNLRIL